MGCLIKLKVTFVTIITLWMSWILRHTLQHLYLLIYYMNFPFNKVCGSPANTVLESNKLEYESSCLVVIPEPYLSLWNLGTVYVRLHNTRVHQTRVQDTHNSSLRGSSTSWHFLMPKIQLSHCHSGMLTRNSSFLNSSTI